MRREIQGSDARHQLLMAALRQARTDSGLKQNELSRSLGLSHAAVSGWESGRYTPSIDIVMRLVDRIGVTGQRRKRILELADEGASNLPRWPSNLDKATINRITYELYSRSIVEWCPTIIPSLLQTKRYARSLYCAQGASMLEVDDRCRIHPHRVQALTRSERPSSFTALISEAALREPIGDAGTMTDQVDHLFKMSHLPNVTVLIVPLFSGWHQGLTSAFAIYQLEGDCQVAIVEDLVSSHVESRRVAVFDSAADAIQYRALSIDASTQFIRDIRDEWRLLAAQMRKGPGSVLGHRSGSTKPGLFSIPEDNVLQRCGAPGSDGAPPTTSAQRP